MDRGRGEVEQSIERANSASLGFMADDVVLATFEYPDLSEAGRAALTQFIELLETFSEVADQGFVVLSAPAQMRMKALSDSLDTLRIRLAGPNSHETAAYLRDATSAILERRATTTHLSDIRECAESLGVLALDRLRELGSRRTTPWTSQTLIFS